MALRAGDGRPAGRVVAGLVVLAGVLVAFVAGSGQVEMFRDVSTPGQTPTPQTTQTLHDPMLQPDRLLPGGTPPLSGPSTTVFATVVAVLVTVALLVAMVWGAVALWRIRWRRPERPPETTVAPLPTVAESVTEDAGAQLALLEEGDPRNAIVACWQRLEQSIAAAGVPRRPAETSAEYAERVLGDLPVDRVMLAGFAELYREARFSEHAMDERARRGALAALRSLHADLAEVADVAPLDAAGSAVTP